MLWQGLQDVFSEKWRFFRQYMRLLTFGVVGKYIKGKRKFCRKWWSCFYIFWNCRSLFRNKWCEAWSLEIKTVYKAYLTRFKKILKLRSSAQSSYQNFYQLLLSILIKTSAKPRYWTLIFCLWLSRKTVFAHTCTRTFQIWFFWQFL